MRNLSVLKQAVSRVEDRDAADRGRRDDRAFPAAEELQTPPTHRLSFLALTSAQSSRRATERNSPAIMPNPTDKVSVPSAHYETVDEALDALESALTQWMEQNA
jgi:hypothetical protein